MGTFFLITVNDAWPLLLRWNCVYSSQTAEEEQQLNLKKKYRRRPPQPVIDKPMCLKFEILACLPTSYIAVSNVGHENFVPCGVYTSWSFEYLLDVLYCCIFYIWNRVYIQYNKCTINCNDTHKKTAFTTTLTQTDSEMRRSAIIPQGKVTQT